MSASDQPGRVARRLRLLEVYAVCSSVALLVLVAAAFAPARQQVDVLQARRVEILNEDGRYALVIAGRGRLPGPTFEGREYPQELSGGRVQGSGMIFFNERGDEVGGLTYRGQVAGDSYRASAGITFDQFRQDQVVSVQYQDDGTSRRAGLAVWDRSTELSIAELLEVLDARANATGAARDSIERVIEGLRERGGSADRVFLGSANRTATLLLRDTRGRARIRLYVDTADAARLEFLDTAGAVVHAFPQ
jgi:hypothetical protein